VLTEYAERGYDLTFRSPKTDTPPIIEYDIPTFSHIILFAPDTKCERFHAYICRFIEFLQRFLRTSLPRL
jgi:hypothetical protein